MAKGKNKKKQQGPIQIIVDSLEALPDEEKDARLNAIASDNAARTTLQQIAENTEEPTEYRIQSAAILLAN